MCLDRIGAVCAPFIEGIKATNRDSRDCTCHNRLLYPIHGHSVGNLCGHERRIHDRGLRTCLSDGKMPLFLAGRTRSVGGVIQVHLAFLLALILWTWLAQYSKPFLPDWVVAEGGQHGSWFLVFVLLGIVALLLFEYWWLQAKAKVGP